MVAIAAPEVIVWLSSSVSNSEEITTWLLPTPKDTGAAPAAAAQPNPEASRTAAIMSFGGRSPTSPL
jgi:hypothetical protein